MKYACKSVVGGWQTVAQFLNDETEYLVGPIFNSCTALWAWQKLNLPMGEK